MNEIYITKTNQEQNREVVIEGDDHSVWAYVLKHSDDSVGFEFDGFICSRGTIVESNQEVQEFIDKANSPPLMKKYSNEFSVQNKLESKDLEIDWNGSEIKVKVNGIDFLIMDIEIRKSYSKATSQKGPYGIPIEEKTNNNGNYKK